MTDLRELLREVLTDTADGTICMSLSLHRRIKEALAHPPDAKPYEPLLQWVRNVMRKMCMCEADEREVTECLDAIDAAIAAPQPPAGKGMEDNYVAWLRWNGRTWTACDSDAKGAFKVYRHPSNAIPREIHERLIRDAKLEGFREAFREAARRFDNASNEVFSRHDVAQELEGMADTMASEHKRGRE
jgi:hypothetical protein